MNLCSFKLIADEYRKIEEFEPSTQRRNNFVWDTFYAAIGNYQIDSIAPSQILEVCRLYERQRKIESAKRMRSKASQVFRYAKAFKPAAWVLAKTANQRTILPSGYELHANTLFPLKACRGHFSKHLIANFDLDKDAIRSLTVSALENFEKLILLNTSQVWYCTVLVGLSCAWQYATLKITKSL